MASTGKRETDALSSSSSSKKYIASADDSIGDISIGEAGADKSQDMFSHLFGDSNPALEVHVPKDGAGADDDVGTDARALDACTLADENATGERAP